MQAKQTPDGFSLQFGTGPPPLESANELFLKTATSPTFPFMHVRITEDETAEDVTVNIRVNKKIHEFLKFIGSEDTAFYFANNGGLIQWGFDMVAAMKILSNLGIVPAVDDWARTARESLAKSMGGEKIEPVFECENALANSKEILASLEILDRVDEAKLLFSTATEALRDRAMDSGTLIYRLAMAVYHHNGGAFVPTLAAVDDPSLAYLKLIKSSSYGKWESEFSDMMNLPLESRIQITKVLVAFVIASYVYHKTAKGDTDG